MIYPTSSSVSLLVGAVFLIDPFPDFATPQQSGRTNQPNAVTGQGSHQVWLYQEFAEFGLIPLSSTHTATTKAPDVIPHLEMDQGDGLRSNRYRGMERFSTPLFQVATRYASRKTLTN